MHKKGEPATNNNIIFTRFKLNWLSFSYKLAKMLSVRLDICLDINLGGTNRSRCTHRLVILLALLMINEP